MSTPNSLKKALKVDAWTLLGTALVAVLVVLVNYVSFRRYERFDLTRDRLFTLSERTEKLLVSLPRPVNIYVFMGSGEQTYPELRELLTRYKSKSSKLQVHFVDPDREPTRFRVLAEKFGVRVDMQENGQTEAELAALVESGDKRWSITRDDLVQVDYESLEGGGGKGPKVDVKTEQALSGAIVQVTSGRATKVCVSEGHGEWTLEAGGERGLLTMKEELKRENIAVEALSTRGKSALPKECDAVFVLGPTKAFASEESELLKKYLEAGGNLLLLVDPIISGDQLQPSGLEALTLAYGVRLDEDVVVELDTQRLLSPSPIEHFVTTSFSEHRLVRPLLTMRAPVVLALARSISINEGSDAQALFTTSDKAYGETSLSALSAGDDLKAGQGDVTGPLTLAVAVETRPGEAGNKQRGGRMIVAGDSDWLSAQLLQQPQLVNVDLLSSVTGYLTERDALVSIAPRKINAQAIVITEDGLFSVFLRVVVLLPLAIAVLGVGVWWQRKK